MKEPSVKNYSLYPGIHSYNYTGEAVSRINITEPEPVVQTFVIDFPIDIAKTKNNTLCIYQYTEANGFEFLEYDPVDETLQVLGHKQTLTSLHYITMCESSNDLFYAYEGMLYYGTTDGIEADISPDSVSLYLAPVYQNGYVYYINSDYEKLSIERINVSGIINNNRPIRLLMHESTQDLPFGCGYKMEKTTLSSEQYALKILAQDTDYDLYLLSSGNYASYNLKENGAFYPLNNVPGVSEYLDACFPYLKETATDEDGNIWMIPVSLAIPWLVYDKNTCAKGDFPVPEALNFFEFIEYTTNYKKTNPDGADISTNMLKENYFSQYLACFSSFDTPEFRAFSSYLGNELAGGDREAAKIIVENATQEGKSVDLGCDWKFSDKICSSIIAGDEVEPFWYSYQKYTYNLKYFMDYIKDSERFGVCGMARINECDSNCGTLTFLMVNPASDNLKSTLAFIETFCGYMSSKKDSLLLSDFSSYTDTPFMRELYDVFSNGLVTFNMDRDVYTDLYSEYINLRIDLEPMIKEIERRRKIFMGE